MEKTKDWRSARESVSVCKYMWNSTWHGKVLAQAYQRAKPAKLPLRDAEGQQSPGLASYRYSLNAKPLMPSRLIVLSGQT